MSIVWAAVWAAVVVVGAGAAAHAQSQAQSDAESVLDVQRRVARGEISPLKVWRDEALPPSIRAAWGLDSNASGSARRAEMERLRRSTAAAAEATRSRGGTVEYLDDFSTYVRSADPVFDRFAVSMQGQLSPGPLGGIPWFSVQQWWIPTLFVEPAPVDPETGLADGLPRWQGATLRVDGAGAMLLGDVNGDCVVDSADLGAVLAAFGATLPPFTGANLNGDTVVSTPDLGLLLGRFGQSCGLVCLYEVMEAHTTDTGGAALDAATVGAGPGVGDVIAVANGVWGNDSDPADGCGDCAFFRIDPVGGAEGERVYGSWTLIASSAMSAEMADFVALREDDTCAGWGENAALADARGEDQSLLQAGVCCFFGARAPFAHFCANEEAPVVVDVDVFKESLRTFTSVNLHSSLCCGVKSIFVGGYAQALDESLAQADTTGDGYMDAFVVPGNLPGNLQFGEMFATIPDGMGSAGKSCLAGEWFTIRFKVFTNEIQIWLRDSETMTLVDPAPGDDGGGTPLDGSDDIEGGFAKIFPIGPYGRCASVENDGVVAQTPQPALASVCVNQVRFMWGGDPTAFQDPDYRITNTYFDNIRVNGVPHEFPDQPKFALPFLDDIETYQAGGPLGVQGGWLDEWSNRAVITTTLAASGKQSIKQQNWLNDGAYRAEFERGLPLAAAQSGSVVAGCKVALSGPGVIRGVRLVDDEFLGGEAGEVIARLLTGVEDGTGLAVVDGMGRSRFHVRTRNPIFDPAVEPLPDGFHPDRMTPEPPGNLEYINVPTDRLLDAADTFLDVEFEIAPDRSMAIRIDGAPVLPDAALAPLVGYGAAGWEAESIAVSAMGFDSGNQTMAPMEALYVDDVRLSGAAPIVVGGPPFALPYEDDFGAYPEGAPIDGQGGTPFVQSGMPVARWKGGLGGEITVIDDPTASGRGNVLRTVNNGGFTEDDSIFIALRSTLPVADADAGSAVVVEYDVWVQDLNSRLVVSHSGPEGGITDIMFGGPDNVNEDNPGGSAYASTGTFRLLEKNPSFGGPFSMGPEFWFVDSGESVPLQAWTRMALTVQPGGAYTYTFDGSPITTPAGAFSGVAIDAGADAVDGFDLDQAFDEGGAGRFERGPIEIAADPSLPAGHAFPGDFCFYLIDDIIGAGPMGDPAPCNGAGDIDIGGVVGVLRDSGLPNWPNGGVFEICPESDDYVWRPAGSGGAGPACVGPWNWLDADNPADVANYPHSVDEVDTWARYTLIPPYVQPAPASRWYIDNLRIEVLPGP